MSKLIREDFSDLQFTLMDLQEDAFNAEDKDAYMFATKLLNELQEFNDQKSKGKGS